MNEIEQPTTQSATPPPSLAAGSYRGSRAVTFSCTARTSDQIKSWISDAQLIMFGAKANQSDVLAIMTAALVACGWKPGRTVSITISPPTVEPRVTTPMGSNQSSAKGKSPNAKA